jgi:hypothetical protein
VRPARISIATSGLRDRSYTQTKSMRQGGRHEHGITGR